jgi:hypothetical protein
MNLYDEVQEIDPSMCTRRGHKKYRRRILVEQLDEHFCRHSKRNKNKVGESKDQNVVHGVNVPVTIEVWNCSYLYFFVGPAHILIIVESRPLKANNYNWWSANHVPFSYKQCITAPVVQTTSLEIHEIITLEVKTHLIHSFVADTKEVFLSLFPIGL